MNYNREDIQWEHICGFIESACLVLSTIDQCVDLKILFPETELTKEDVQRSALQIIANGLNTINEAAE